MGFFKNLIGSRASPEQPQSKRQRLCGVCGSELHIREHVTDMTHEGLYHCTDCDLLVRNAVAVGRDIVFDEKGGASENCCGNCRWSSLSPKYATVGRTNPMWCTKYEDKVDRRDLCKIFWSVRSGI